MPRYDFLCLGCGWRGELSFTSARDAEQPLLCAWCDETRPLEKQASAPAFVLKGAGFHAVDYAKGSR